jgi:hypothetical protein
MTKKTVSILDFDAVKDSSNAIDVDMKSVDGESLGIIFKVIGKNADEVQQLQRKMMRKRQSEEFIAQRKGKPLDPVPIEELEEQGLDLTAVRVVGWEGVNEPFTKELLMQVLKRNPHWVEQVLEASSADANFTKSV